MHILSDKSCKFSTIEVSQVASDHIGEQLKLIIVSCEPLVKCIWLILHLVDSFFSLRAPLDHIDSDHDLGRLI